MRLAPHSRCCVPGMLSLAVIVVLLQHVSGLPLPSSKLSRHTPGLCCWDISGSLGLAQAAACQCACRLSCCFVHCMLLLLLYRLQPGGHTGGIGAGCATLALCQAAAGCHTAPQARAAEGAGGGAAAAGGPAAAAGGCKHTPASMSMFSSSVVNAQDCRMLWLIGVLCDH